MSTASNHCPQELITKTGDRWKCICEPAEAGLHYLYSLRREGRGGEPLSLFIELWPHPRIKTRLNLYAKYSYHRGNHPIEVVFIYGLRVKKKEALARAADPVGPRADDIILKAALRAQRIFCVWADLGPHPHRAEEVVIALRQIQAHLECFNTPNEETGTPHDPRRRFRIRSPQCYNYWPAPVPPTGAPKAKVRCVLPTARIEEVTKKPWFGWGSASFYGLFQPGFYRCPFCEAKTPLNPEQLHGNPDHQQRETLPDIAYAFERAAPESRWGLAYDFHCRGCDRPVRVIFDVCERNKMSGQFFPGISRFLELEEQVHE